MTDATTIEEDLDGEQLIATVPSNLAMPIDPPEITPPTIAEIQKFIQEQNEDRDNQEKKRNGQRVANYYFTRLQMEELEQYLKNRFPDTWKDKFQIAENFVKSMSRQLSAIYKAAPSRDPKAERGETVSEADLQANDELIDFIYKRGKLDVAFQEVERFAKWARSVLVRVQYSRESTKIIMKPYSPQFWDVMVTAGGELRAVIISDYHDNHTSQQDQQKRRWWVWTTEIEGMLLVGPDLRVKDPGTVNESGVIPFVLHNDEPAVENEKPYLHADILMANTNLAINKNLTDGESLIEYQIYGLPYIIGGDADKIPTEVGHNQFLHIPRTTMEESDPIIGILQPKADIAALLMFIERLANGYATSRGLAPDSFSSQKTNAPQSGISLKLKNHVLLEMRDSEEDKYACLENEIFKVVRAVSNAWYNVKGGHKFGEISDKINIEVEFDDNDEAFENEAESQSQALAEVSQGLLKPTDFVGRRFPRKSLDEKKEYLKEVTEEKKEFGLMTTLEDIDNALGADNEGGNLETAE